MRWAYIDTDSHESYGVDMDGVFWANSNLGADEQNNYGLLYNHDQAKGACPKGWRLPTKAELTALCAHYSEFTTFDGMKGRWFSGSNAYSGKVPAIFLPAAGNGSFRGSYGWYWSSTEYSSGSAYDLYIDSYKANMDYSSRPNSFSVRCVKD